MTLEDLPTTTVQIGFRTMKIVPMDEIEMDRTGYTGMIDIHAGEIRIFLGVDKQMYAQILLHEIMHGAWALVAGLPNEGDKKVRLTQERVVTTMTHGLAAAMRDNTDLFYWIHASL